MNLFRTILLVAMVAVSTRQSVYGSSDGSNSGRSDPAPAVAPAPWEDEASKAIAAAQRGDVMTTNAAICDMMEQGADNDSVVSTLERAIKELKGRVKLTMSPITPQLRLEELGRVWPPEPETAKVPGVALRNLEEMLVSIRGTPSGPSGVMNASVRTGFSVRHKGKPTEGLFLFGSNGLKSDLGVWGKKLLEGEEFLDKAGWYGEISPFADLPNRLAFVWKWHERPIQLQQDPWIGGLGAITFDSDGYRRFTATYDDGGAWAIDGAPMLVSRDEKGNALPAGHKITSKGWFAKGEHLLALYLYDHGNDWGFSLTLEKLVSDESGNPAWVPEPIVIKHGASLRSRREVQEMFVSQNR